MLSVSVKGGILLGFGSANPCTEETYNTGKFKTYQGYVLAVVRAQDPGIIEVTVKGANLSPVTVEITAGTY